MIVELLVLHRKEDYPGQHAPEVMAVADESVLEENPGWWIDEQRRLRHDVGEDAAAWTVVQAEISADDLMQALYPKINVTMTMEEPS